MRTWFAGLCLAGLGGVAGMLWASPSQPLEVSMRDKLSHAQQILEALVASDFPAVDRHAERLSRISETEIASWQANPQPEYIRQAVVFLSSVQGLRDAAARRDSDLALQEYGALVSSCVRCHRLPGAARVRFDGRGDDHRLSFQGNRASMPANAHGPAR